MLLTIYSKNTLQLLGNINTYNYVSYTDEFNGKGNFEIKIPTNEQSLFYLVFGNYIHFEDHIVGIIKQVKKSEDSDVEITVNGYLINHLLEYRSFLVTTQYYDYINVIAEQMVEDLFINPEDQKRAISYIEVEQDIREIGQKVRVQNTGNTLFDVLSEMLLPYDLGFELEPQIEMTANGNEITSFVFKIMQAVDRTITNTDDNDPVVFSFDLDNLTNLEYEEDGRQYRNIAIVAGEGTGEDRKTLEVGDLVSSGINRIELYVDARDLQSESEGSTITDEELEELMQQRGLEKLGENIIFISADSTISTNSMQYKYGVDFNKGDFVSVYSKTLDKLMNLQISSITKSISNGTEIFDIDFGKDRLSIYDLNERSMF